jgi:hypothetical protein
MTTASALRWALFRPLDLVVAGLILLSAGLALPLLTAPSGTRAEVFLGNRKVARLDLEGPPRRMELATASGGFGLEYGLGHVRVTHAPCPNQLCVKAGPVSRSGSALICLPCKVRVEVGGAGRSGDAERPDGITY